MKNYQLREIKRRYWAKKRRNQLILRLGTMSALLVVTLVAVVLIQKDKLKGTWNYDGTTVYQFDGEGNGMLILPSKDYKFYYEIKKNELLIDFVEENARDFVYKFDVDEDTLILVDKKGEEKVIYTMKRKEQNVGPILTHP